MGDRAAELVAAVRAAKQFLTFAGATPFQYAGAAALRLSDGWYRRSPTTAGQARPPVRRLQPVHVSRGRRARTSPTSTSARDATGSRASCPYKAGVVAIPTSVFCTRPERLSPYLRFAFCKRLPVIDEAARAPSRPRVVVPERGSSAAIARAAGDDTARRR